VWQLPLIALWWPANDHKWYLIIREWINQWKKDDSWKRQTAGGMLKKERTEIESHVLVVVIVRTAVEQLIKIIYRY
jgi:hypothetical protein